MKITAAAALAVLAFAGSTHAYMFSPNHTKFKLDGNVIVLGTASCKLVAAGTTKGDRALITSANLNGNPTCRMLFARSFPWKVEMSDGGEPLIRNVRFISHYANYHARRQAGTVDGSGNWTFIPSGTLDMSGTVASKPPITITP
jgi:hypothetical protein